MTGKNSGLNRLRQFGERLRSLRQLEGLTQAELAEKAGISFEHVNKMERGAAAPSFATVCALAGALEVETAHLFLFSEDAEGDEEDIPKNGLPSPLPSSLANIGYWEYIAGHGDTVFSESLFRLLGYAPGEVEPSLELMRRHVLNEDKHRLEKLLELALEGEPLKGLELRVLRRDGQVRHAILGCKALQGEEGGPKRVCGVALDVTEFKRFNDALTRARAKLEGRVMERTEMLDAVSRELDNERRHSRHLRQSLTIFETLLSSTRESLCFVDTNYVYRAANEACLRMHGRERQDMVGRCVPDVLGEEAFIKSIKPMLDASFEGREAACQNWFHIPDLGRRFLEVSYAPCLDGERILGALMVIRDASQRKRYEEGLRRSKQEAESESRSKTEFLANMGHELRMPLNGVLGMLQLLRMSLLDNEQSEYADRATAACKDLLETINEILDYARIETGKVSLVIKPLELGELLKSIRSGFERKAKSKGLALELVAGKGAAQPVMADSGRIRQVLVNLVNNAIKFTDQGKVTVRAELKDMGEASGTLICTVHDTGPGIPAEHKQRIFDAFHQVDGSYARKYKGIGLGLAIAKRLVESMGGEISVENQSPGTAFTLAIPVRPVPEDYVREEQPELRLLAPATSLRVLVVEDDAVCGLAAERMLSGLGHQPVIVTTGQEALEVLNADFFDMVLMDVQLPGMDGLETLARIRASKSPNAKIPVAALTACATKSEREYFLAAGMNDFLAKPVDLRDLKLLLARLTADNA